MARIKIKRSTTDQSTPSGLTFGELAYLPGGTGNTADRLFIGDNDAASVWIGAEIENSPQNWTNSTRLATQAATNSRISSLITNSAVTSFNGLTGSVQGVSAAVAGTGIAVSGATGSVTITNTGVQLFNGLTGSVQGVSAAVAGTGIAVSGATGSVTITNIGVQSFNGLTGQVTGASLGANTFTELNTFNAGISAAGGVTFANNISVNGLRVGRGAGNVSTNTAVGTGSLNANTTGQLNVAVGSEALLSNTTGIMNSAVGGYALFANTIGINNSAVGMSALFANTTGVGNSAVGLGALQNNTTGSNNVAIGTEAGAYDNIDEESLTDPENSIYIGFNSRGFDNNDNNTIVIGANAVADGANTTVIGNSSTTSTRVFGTLSTNGGISAAGGTFSALTRFTAGISAAGATLSGTVTAPTPAVGTNNTQVATTAFVMANAVTSFNGLTGSLQGVSAAVAGTGIAVSGATGSVTITNIGVQSFNGLTGSVQGVSAAVAGTGIAVSGATGSVTITNTGVQSFNGLTGSVTGVTTSVANTFTALQTFNTGISASGGITFSGTTNTLDIIASTDGAGLRIAKGIASTPTRIGGIRLGMSGTTAFNTYLENNTGVFTVYNGVDATGTKLADFASSANVLYGLNRFPSGLSAAGATFSGAVNFENALLSGATFSSSVRVGSSTESGQLDIRNHDTRYLSLIDNASGSEIVSMGNSTLKIYQAIGGGIYIGDYDGNNNGTYITVEDQNQQISFTFNYGGDSYTFPTNAGGAGQVLTSNGAGTLYWANGPSKTCAVFTAPDNQPPALNAASSDTRNSIKVLDFDSSTAESAVFVGVIPESAADIMNNGLKVRIRWMATTATSGAVRWGAQFMNLNTDCDSDSFATATEGNTTTNATSGTPSTTELLFAFNTDGLVAGDFFRLKIYRAADNAADTMSGDAELIAVEVQTGGFISLGLF